jgi:hypothetical protein
VTNYGPASAFFLVGGRDLSGDSFNLKDRVEQVTQQGHGLGDLWEENLPVGLARIIIEAGGGFYDERLLGINEALVGQGGTQQEVAYGMAGRGIGAEMAFPDGAFAMNYKRGPSREGLTQADAEYRVTGTYRRGRTVHALVSETAASGDTKASSVDQSTSARLPSVAITSSSVANPTQITTPVPHGLVSGQVILISGHSGSTPSLNGGNGYVVTVVDTTHFTIPVNVTVGGTGGTFTVVSTESSVWVLHPTDLALDGGTSVTILGLHSADNSTWTTAVTFSNVTAAGVAQRQTLATRTNRWRAMSWAFNGGAGANRKITPYVAVSLER